jgi:hypothetical protein
MDTGAEAMPVPDRLRLGWRSRGAASGVGDPPAPVADEVLLERVADGDPSPAPSWPSWGAAGSSTGEPSAT